MTVRVAGSNSTEGMTFSVCHIGSVFCDGLITRSEDSFRLCVSNCVRYRNINDEAA